MKPRSTWAIPPFYIYKKATLSYVAKYLDEGKNPDSPGQFVAWLVGKKPIYAYRFSGRRYDIGTFASYREVQCAFGEPEQLWD